MQKRKEAQGIRYIRRIAKKTSQIKKGGRT